MSRSSVWRRRSAMRRNFWATSCTSSGSEKGSKLSRVAVESSIVSSNSSATSRPSRSPWRAASSRYLRFSSSSSESAFIDRVSRYPCSEASGVRRSCEMLATISRRAASAWRSCSIWSAIRCDISSTATPRRSISSPRRRQPASFIGLAKPSSRNRSTAVVRRASRRVSQAKDRTPVASATARARTPASRASRRIRLCDTMPATDW